jgi:hypothetical protein
MLLAREHAVPEPYATTCAHLLQRCTLRERSLMASDARKWAELSQ